MNLCFAELILHGVHYSVLTLAEAGSNKWWQCVGDYYYKNSVKSTVL